MESGVEDAAVVESEFAEALLVELLFAVELAVEEAAALPFVLPSTLTAVLTFDHVTVPVDLSIVPPLSAELGTKPPAKYIAIGVSFLAAITAWTVRLRKGKNCRPAQHQQR